MPPGASLRFDGVKLGAHAGSTLYTRSANKPTNQPARRPRTEQLFKRADNAEYRAAASERARATHFSPPLLRRMCVSRVSLALLTAAPVYESFGGSNALMGPNNNASACLRETLFNYGNKHAAPREIIESPHKTRDKSVVVALYRVR